MRYEGMLVIFGVALVVGVWLLATYMGLKARHGRLMNARAQLAATTQLRDAPARDQSARPPGDAEDVEQRLLAARRRYDLALADYDGLRESFPTVLLSGLLGFGPEGPGEESAERAPLEARR